MIISTSQQRTYQYFRPLLSSSRLLSCYLVMSYFLPHLPSGWHVDQAIVSEEDRVVVIRFGDASDKDCMVMDETLYNVSEKVQNFAVIYLCDITEVPDFNKVCLFHLLEQRRMTELIIHWDTRCMNFTIPARWCSSIGKHLDYVLNMEHYSASSYASNKHIMIDLGTGNNNKM